ncbi:RluA family pseudouridine synthase [Alkalimonas sp.]|uniref:RluA family pseudouridine synthase n=1 Tax=Alkalimonas sp. TaxID=1872453 RepID=UPI00263A522A|nr:RluA family pseudouridine synthase [Alkalimonas sp.]MCC5824554.1 RluA family pseudouridine synthase [Alkalimonas sp.]
MTTAVTELAVLPATNQTYQVLFQDDHLLVVNKPCHLLTVPGRHPDNQDCLIKRVQQQFPSASVVHRLDYDTSGLLVLPLTSAALSAISKQFQARTVTKSYLAVVAGQWPQSRGRIDLAIAPDADNRPRYKICPQGKASVTDFELLAYDAKSDTSRIRLKPVTGRSHQLRLHTAAFGHPILGDPFYAPKAVQAQSARLLLHAATLAFLHPLSEHPLTFEAAADF